MKVLVLILNCNQEGQTLACLNSLNKSCYTHYGIVVVDNASEDNSVKTIKERFPQVKIIKNRVNTGCAGGRNIGINFFLNNTEGNYLLFLDNDTEIDKCLLSELINVAESDSQIGVVGMKAYYYNESDKFWAVGGAKMNWYRGFFYNLGHGDIDKGQLNKGKDIDCVPGGFTFIKREVLEKVGILDERYFIYYEDSDWCIRVKKAGFKIAFAPRAKVWHKVSSSLGMNSSAFYYYRTRNRLLFMWKNASKMHLAFFFFYFIYDFSYNTLLTLYLSHKPQQLRAAIIGLLDFIRGRFGKRALKENLLQNPLYRTLVIKLTDKLWQFLIIFSRNIKFLIKRLLRIRLKILVELDWNLGDEIMAIPAYKAVKERYPKSIINVKVKYPELLYNNPYIDKINENLRSYDKIFNLKGEDRTKNRLDYLSKKIKLKIRDRIPRVFFVRNETENLRESALDLRISALKIAISTGASWKSRQWGVENFRKVAKYLIEKYDAQIIELGKDCESIGLGINLINKTSIREAAIIFKKCNLFIGNDSGLVHLALALGTLTIALFGPLDPYKLITKQNNFYPIWSKAECRGCWSAGRMFYPDVCPKGIADCMEKIELEDVIKIVNKYLLKQKL